MNEYQVIIGNTYYNQNYFNVGVNASNHLGEHGENLSIVLPNNLIIPSTIDREINNNGYVRFYGCVAWNEFIQANYVLGDTITFQVNNLNTITIIPNAQ
jgi:hypothetical protein